MYNRRLPVSVKTFAVLALVASLTAPVRVHAFSLSGTKFVEGLEKAADMLEAAEEAERRGAGAAEQFVHEQSDELAEKAADAIEYGSIKAGRKVWDTLMRSDSKMGELAKKAARRWGPAVRHGYRLAGPVGKGVDAAQAGYTVGNAVAKSVTIPLLVRVQGEQTMELEEQIRRVIEAIRKQAEFSSTLDERIAEYRRESQAMDEEERRLYGSEGVSIASDTWSDDVGSEERNPWEAVEPNEPDVWETETATQEPDVWGSYGEAQQLQAWEGRDATSDPWSGYENSELGDPWREWTSNAPDPWQEGGAARSRQGSGWDEWHRERAEANWPIEDDEGRSDPDTIANAMGDADASEGDYRSALEALERREAEERRAAEAERLRAEQQAERERQAALAQQRAAREAQRMEAEAKAARRAEREAQTRMWATTISQTILSIAAARQGYTDPSHIPSVTSLSNSTASFRAPGLTRPPSLSEPTSLGSAGSGKGIDPQSSDCQEDLNPVCQQVMAIIETRTAEIQTRLEAGGLSMSQTYDLAAEQFKVFLDHAPSCFATETRPHCVAANIRDLEEVRKSYQSALEGARQARGE